MCTEYKEISLALKGKIPFSDKVEISCECGKNFTGKLKQNLPLLDCPECLRRYSMNLSGIKNEGIWRNDGYEEEYEFLKDLGVQALAVEHITVAFKDDKRSI